MILIRILVFVILPCLHIPFPELKLVTAEDPPKPPAPAPVPVPGPAPASGLASTPGSPSPPVADTNDDYYTLTHNPTDSQKFLPQDNADAAIIKDELAKPNPKYEIIAFVLGLRDRTRRIEINNSLIKDGHPLIDKTYIPQDSKNTVFKDVCFGLVKEEEEVIASYISKGLEKKEETEIIIGMVLTKDMESMVKTFNSCFDKDFDDLRKEQKHPFENMLKVWAQKNREKEKPGAVNDADVKKDAKALLKEQGKWNDKFGNKRNQLELILMVKSIKYARAVIAEFEKERNNVPIEKIITDTIKNKDLADAYSSLAAYVKDRGQYIANMLDQHMTDADGYSYAGWVMALASVKPEEWPKISAAYAAKAHKSLSNAIGDCSDVTLAPFRELMAMTVDPQFQPEYIMTIVPKNMLQSYAPQKQCQNQDQNQDQNQNQNQPQGQHH